MNRNVIVKVGVWRGRSNNSKGGAILRKPRLTKHHKSEKKEPTEVLFALAELNFAFENVVFHISKNIYAQLDAN
jgi:hypothetical protein